MEPVASANAEAVEAALRDALQGYVTPDGVVASASTWIVSARAPGGRAGAN